MLGTSGVELLGIVDPQLTWNTDSKGRHRAPRRPRTSFLAETRQKVRVKHLSHNDCSTVGDLKCQEMSVLESEKLGVTILGHHFDGSLEGVPIKKRLLLAHSPISSRDSPPNPSGIPDHVLDGQGSHHVNRNVESLGLSSGTSSDGADFSGISILAAAACSSRFGGDITISEASISKAEEHDCPEKDLKIVGSHKEKSSDIGVSGSKADISEMPVDVFGLSAVENGSCTGGVHSSDENMCCSDNIEIEGNEASHKVKISSRNDKLHWDLNKEMDAWEFPDDEDADFINGSTDDGVCNDKSHTDELCCPVDHKTELVGEAVSSSILRDRKKCMSFDTPAEPKMLYSCNNVENVILPLASHNLSRMLSSHRILEELKPSNATQNSTGYAMDISLKTYTFGEKSDNSSFTCGPTGEASCNVFTGTTCIKPEPDQFNMDVVVDHVTLLVGPQDEIHDNNGDLHNSMPAYAVRKNGNQERSPKDEDFESILVDFPTHRIARSKKMGLCCEDGDKIGEIETAESHCYHGCQSIDDVESSHSSRERDGSPEHGDCVSNPVTVDFCDQKELKGGLDDPSGAVLTANNMSMLVNVSSSHDACSSLTNAVVKKQVENGPEDCLVGDCNSDPSATASGCATEMEKPEIHRDDDSQYEDGELRESVLHGWIMDCDEDGEDEHVDYGSDERENYTYEDAFDSPASAVLPDVENTECKVDNLSENFRIHPIADRVSKESLETKSQPNSQCLNVEAAKGRTNLHKENYIKIKDGNENLEKSIEDTPHCTDNNGVRYAEHIGKGESSGLNQLPVDPELTADPDKGLCVKDKLTYILDAAKTSKSCQKVAESKCPRDFLSRIEGDRSSEFSRSKDGTCHQASRVSKIDDLNHTAEMDHDHTLFLRKVGPFHLEEARSKGSSWDESLNQWIPNQRERRIYYGSSGYVQSAPKNAVEAAAAKVESNGFAVAPDGTVVEPSHLESTGWSSRRNANDSAQAAYRSLAGRLSSTGRDRLSRIERDDILAFNSQPKRRISRGVNPDRHLHDDEGSYRHGPRLLSAGRKEKYIMHISGDRIDSSLPSHRTILRRDRSPSLQRDSGPPERRGRSHSRSRTRSPHAWTSPTRIDGGRISDNHGFRHCNRSPSGYRSDGRGEPVKLPYRHANYVDGLSDFVPSLRNHPNQPSRPIHERRDLENSLRRREYRVYRQSSERIPPERPFSRSHRFDVLDSGRMDPEEYYRQVHPGRHVEFVSAGKRPRFDDDDDRRGHSNRYEMLISPSSRQYALGEMKRLRCDDCNEFRLENARLKNDPEFEDRDTLRGFLGGCEGQLGGSPRRSNEEKGHFRYGREVRHGAKSKSAGMQECDKDINPLRRRQS